MPVATEVTRIDPLEHQRLVMKIARLYLGRGLEYDDLVGEGQVGLLRACEGYDPDRATKFGTYAFHAIRRHIQRAVSACRGMVTFDDLLAIDPGQSPGSGPELADTLSCLLDQLPSRHARILKMRYGLDPYAPMSLEEAGRELGLTKQRVQQIQADALKRLRSLATEASLT